MLLSNGGGSPMIRQGLGMKKKAFWYLSRVCRAGT